MKIGGAAALAGLGAACGAAGGLVLGLVVQRLTYPHLATWPAVAAWGAAAGVFGGLLAAVMFKPGRPFREHAAAVPVAFCAAMAGVAAIMAFGARVGMLMFDAGIQRAFIGVEGVNPRRQTMIASAWALRNVAAAFGLLLFAWGLSRNHLAPAWRRALPALTLCALAAAVALMAAPAYKAYAPASHSHATDARSVQTLMHKVATWQLLRPRYRPTEWHNCPWHAGLLALHRASGLESYRQHLVQTGEALGWQLGPQLRLADDHCVGSVYLDLYADQQDLRRIQPTRQRFDDLMAQPPPGRQEWWWSDALFMAPPVLARLSAATGQRAYLDYMDRLFWDSVDHLYDPKARLFHRDEQARVEAAAQGRLLFWGRGNAWVLAGLARTLPYLPPDHPSRSRYVDLFCDMAQAVLAAQQPDGFWRSSLLEPQAFAGGESSATALFTFALAWGVNEGHLPAAAFQPAVLRAWAALSGAVTEEGRLGWVQAEARAPGPARRFDHELYASGALLLAGAEMIRTTTLLGSVTPGGARR